MTWFERLFGSKKKPDAQPTPRQQREELEEQLKLQRLKRAQKVMESYANQDYWMTAYADVLARYRDGGVLTYPISQPTDRRYGGNFPFWSSEQQLSLLRAQARMVTTMSPNAQGLLNGLCSYVIGTGYSYKVAAKDGADISDELITQAQNAIDEFCEDNSWAEMEQELFWRSREDGEAFLRLFPQGNGKLHVRTIEPEQVFQPPGSTLPNWSYGIKTDPDDVFEIQAYYVHYLAPGGESAESGATLGEEVNAENVVHIKCNVKRAIKRGLTDFSYDTCDAFLIAGKLRANMGEGAAVQAAIAGIRQHDTANLNQVETFTQQQIDYSTVSPITSKETDYQTIQSGSFLDIPKGMNYVPPPGANNASAHLEIFQALLRSAGNRHNAPEWLVSSNASNNNYASSLTAESPFLRTCLRLQKFYERPFCRVIYAVLETAAKAGKLPRNILDLIHVQVTAPSVETRDKAQEAQANQVYATLGVKSPQTIAHEIGLDWDEEMQNQQEARQELGTGAQLPTSPDQLPPDSSLGELPEGGTPVWGITEDGRWVTIGAQATRNREDGEGAVKRGGVAVYIDGDGNITKGPAHMMGKKPNEIKKQQRIGDDPVPAQGTIFGKDTQPPKSVTPEPEPAPAPEPEPEPAKPEPAPAEPEKPARKKRARPTLPSEKKLMADAAEAGLDPEGVLDHAREQYRAENEKYQLKLKMRAEVRRLFRSFTGKPIPSARWKGWDKDEWESIPGYDQIQASLSASGSEYVTGGLLSDQGIYGNDDTRRAATYVKGQGYVGGETGDNGQRILDIINPRKGLRPPNREEIYRKALDDAWDLPGMRKDDSPEDPFGGILPGDDEYSGRDWSAEESKGKRRKRANEANEKPGLWANIRAKRKRGERRARKGSADYPDKDAFQQAQEAEGGKYDHIDFTPPKGARAAANRSLEVRKSKPASQRGMTPVGIARARDLANGSKLSPDTVRRMKAFFDRHQKDKQGAGWDEQGAGWQAWHGWGGDSGYAWARKIVRQMDAADEK